MKSLYGQYVEEREGKGIVEDQYGFATYLHTPSRKEMYVVDVFVVREARKLGKAKEYFDQIEKLAYSLNCDYMLTSVDTETNGFEISIKGLLNNNYVFHGELPNSTFLFFRKDLTNGK